MCSPFRGLLLCIAMGMLSFPAYADDLSKEQYKSLDDQIQEIKSETIGIGTRMRLLEETLLYPSTTQVALYISLDRAAKFRPESIEIQLDGKPAARHVYPLRELEALQKGGVQRIYTGNIASGEHGLQILVRGETADGSSRRDTKNVNFSKDAGPKVLEVRLGETRDGLITFRDW